MAVGADIRRAGASLRMEAIDGAVIRVHEPPLRKPMLLTKVAPVVFTSTTKPLPSLWHSMSTFSKATMRSMMLSEGVPFAAQRSTPLDHECVVLLPVCATMHCAMCRPLAPWNPIPSKSST